MDEYKRETRYIVAILDLLGASEIIKGPTSEINMNHIFEIFQSAKTDWIRVEHAPFVLHDLKFVTFSDNIVMALELPEELSQEEIKTREKDFITYISVFQGASLRNMLLFRGGITIGQLYINPTENLVWGKALVEAHLLEEKTAIYPRVVLSSQFDGADVLTIARIIKDFDGMYFVDYFSTIKEKFPEWIEYSKGRVQEKIEEYRGKERIMQKYKWLQHYIQQ